MTHLEAPTSINQLFTPELGGLAVPVSELSPSSDRAVLITKVYTDMGIFSPGFAEQAPELLRTQPGIMAVDSFVVVNLTPEYNLGSLMTGYNKGQKRPTTPWAPLWNQYSHESINRRTVPGQGQGGIKPTHGEVRVHIATAPENSYDESGLSGTAKDIAEQRALIGSRVVMNLTDYTLLQKLRQEEGREPLDIRTFTRFPQMDFRTVNGGSCVGGADWRDDLSDVYESDDFDDDQIGFRFSGAAKNILFLM